MLARRKGLNPSYYSFGSSLICLSKCIIPLVFLIRERRTARIRVGLECKEYVFRSGLWVGLADQGMSVSSTMSPMTTLCPITPLWVLPLSRSIYQTSPTRSPPLRFSILYSPDLTFFAPYIRRGDPTLPLPGLLPPLKPCIK